MRRRYRTHGPRPIAPTAGRRAGGPARRRQVQARSKSAAAWAPSSSSCCGRGAKRATVVELSHGYDDEARALAREAGAEAADRPAPWRLRRGGSVRSSRPTSSSCTASSAASPTRSCSSAPPAQHARRLLALSLSARTPGGCGSASACANVWFRLRGGIQRYRPSAGADRRDRPSAAGFCARPRRALDPYLAHRRVERRRVHQMFTRARPTLGGDEVPPAARCEPSHETRTCL